ncbi:MAG: hypothetical protein BWX73_03090 [Lentisphaerae bacterium ADurb.Bin082]|nr:MAG: hypothetical protein BWX73_03090 [Lentisphaerae bacterium ADurb.Bin082]
MSLYEARFAFFGNMRNLVMSIGMPFIICLTRGGAALSSRLPWGAMSRPIGAFYRSAAYVKSHFLS